MKKYHFIVPSSFEKMDELSDIFEETAESVSLFEDQGKQEWFFEAVFHQEDIAMIQTLANDAGIQIVIEELPNIDWLKKVYEDFPPLTIGRFYVYGSHVKEVPPADLIPLLVDAATAFGSGHHESTFGCLTALGLLAKSYSFSNMLDMGCGSGILALGMASLWDGSVIGVDNDAQAVRVTIENAQLNRKENLQAFVNDGFSGELLNAFPKFDLIAANILAGPLIEMAPSLAHVLSDSGFVVLAGLLSTQAQDVIAAYQKAGIDLVREMPVKEWSTLILQKRG
jgi:ribosomal protein L11 methyltransferase